MTRKLYALSGVFLIAFVIAGLSVIKVGWVTKVAQATDPLTTRKIIERRHRQPDLRLRRRHRLALPGRNQGEQSPQQSISLFPTKKQA
jgi:hypothetical protein